MVIENDDNMDCDDFYYDLCSLVFYKGKLCYASYDTDDAYEWAYKKENNNYDIVNNYYDFKEDVSISQLRKQDFNDGKNSCTYDDVISFLENDDFEDDD